MFNFIYSIFINFVMMTICSHFIFLLVDFVFQRSFRLRGKLSKQYRVSHITPLPHAPAIFICPNSSLRIRQLRNLRISLYSFSDVTTFLPCLLSYFPWCFQYPVPQYAVQFWQPLKSFGLVILINVPSRGKCRGCIRTGRVQKENHRLGRTEKGLKQSSGKWVGKKETDLREFGGKFIVTQQ